MKSRALIKQQSKNLLKGNWGKAVVMVLITWLSFGVWFGGSMGLLMSGNFGMGALFFVLFIPVIVMVGAGVQYVFLDWVRQGKLADDWFKQIWQVFSDHRLAGKVIRVAYAAAFFEEFWEMIFIVPGWIKRLEYSQALLIMKDHYDHGEVITARQCLKESSLMMNGYKEDFFIFQLSYSGWQILGALPFFIGMLWVGSYMRIGMMIFYRDLSQKQAVRPITVFFPDGTDIEEDIRINNRSLTRANWIAMVYEVALIGLGIGLASFVPGVKVAIQNNTYLVSMEDSLGINSNYYVKFYTDNANKDDEIDSYIMIPASDSKLGQRVLKEITTESNEHPVSYDRQMHQAYRKGVRYVVEGDQLKLKSKDGSILMSNLEVRNKGKQITGDYSFKSDDDSGKVTMTKLNN